MKRFLTAVLMLVATLCFGQGVQHNQFTTNSPGNNVQGNTGWNGEMNLVSVWGFDFGSNLRMSAPQANSLLLNGGNANQNFNTLYFGANGGLGISWPSMAISTNPSPLITVVAGDGVSPANLTVTGIISGNGSGITNVSTADPVATKFFNAAGITDLTAQNDLNIGISQEKSLGCWSSIVQWSAFMPRYNASNHVSVIGNPWVGTNELYQRGGTIAYYTNSDTIPLTTTLSNCSFSVCYVHDTTAANLELLSEFYALAAVYNSNNLSSVVLTSGNNLSQKVDTSVGTNFYFTSSGNTSSNAVYRMMSGLWSQGDRATAILPMVETVSYNSNGLVSVWINGNPTVFNSSSVTNLLLEQGLPGTNFTTFVIGDGGGGWHAIGNHTNLNGSVYFSAIVHNQTVESNTNIPIADMQALFKLLGKTSVVNFVGASRLAYPVNIFQWPANGAIPLTNDMSVIYAQMNPSVLVLNDAYPGSRMFDYVGMKNASESTTYGGRYNFTPSSTYLGKLGYQSVEIKECSGDNDAAGGTNVTTLIGEHNAFYLPLLTNAIAIDLFERGPTGPNTGAANALFRNYFEVAKQQFPFSKTYDEWPRLSLPYLASVALDVTHVGGTNTLAGFNGSVALAQLLSDKTPQPYSPQYYQVSMELPNFTNTQPMSQMSYAMLDTNGNLFGTSEALFTDNTNTFAIAYFQNTSSGGSASGRWDARADNGSPTNAFIGMGINSSAFNGTTAPIGTNMAFIIVYGNSTNVANVSNTASLMIATAQTNSTINFSAGNGITRTNLQLADGGLTLLSGSYSGNGGSLTNLQVTIIQTNFIIGKMYTNTYGSGITVTAKGVNTLSAVAGASDLMLAAAAFPSNGGWTNDLAIQSTALSIAMNYTNTISIFVPTNAAYWFTNASTGAGDSASVVGGQIKYP